MRILRQSFPETLGDASEALAECIQAFADALPIERVILFGSCARGSTRPDSDVDLCVVVRGLRSQQQGARELRKAIGRIRNKPALSLIPISPERLQEKRRIHDPFFNTILHEGVCLAEED